jgi:DNA sulfur modification protein DndB
MPDQSFEFPALKGQMLGRTVYTVHLPTQFAVDHLVFETALLPLPLRAGRLDDPDEKQAWARELNTKTSVAPYPPMIVAINKPPLFEIYAKLDSVGTLRIPAHTAWVVQKGRSFLAALRQHLTANEAPLATERLAVTIYFEPSISKIQSGYRLLQERGSISRTRKILSAESDPVARIARSLATEASPFAGLTELHKSTLAPRAKHLFTLSAIYLATRALLQSSPKLPEPQMLQLARDYWNAVGVQFPEWGQVRTGHLASGELRSKYLHAHGVILHALGRVGALLIKQVPKSWRRALARLSKVNWLRSSSADWEGRAMIGGKVANTTANVILSTSLIKQRLGLDLTAEEREKEKLHAAIFSRP